MAKPLIPLVHPEDGRRCLGDADCLDRLLSNGWELAEPEEGGDPESAPEPEEAPDSPAVSELGLPPTLASALEDAGFEDAAALSGASDDELLSVKGVGQSSLAIIREALAEF